MNLTELAATLQRAAAEAGDIGAAAVNSAKQSAELHQGVQAGPGLLAVLARFGATPQASVAADPATAASTMARRAAALGARKALGG